MVLGWAIIHEGDLRQEGSRVGDQSKHQKGERIFRLFRTSFRAEYMFSNVPNILKLGLPLYNPGLGV